MSAAVQPLFVGLCDDAAVFPPGNLALAEAVPAHVDHKTLAFGPVVGPFVLAARDLEQLAPHVAGLEPGSFGLALTASLPQLSSALEAADQIAAVRLEALEVALAQDVAASEVAPTLKCALGEWDLPVFLELPRDGRRPLLVEALRGTGWQAKLRTGGVRSDLYPDEKELAAAVASLAAAGVPFKATAGLHHALRNTDPVTGFEQHGFLNLLSATAAALAGADEATVVTLLADRDGVRVADRIRRLSPDVRKTFRSFGTCSVAEPVDELIALGLLDPKMREDLS
jgi:hypothetical protein